MHVIDTLGVGGAERMLVDLANVAHRGGHQISVCVTRGETTLAGELHPEIDVLVLGRRRRLDVSAMQRMSRRAAETRVDLFHAHHRSTFSYMAACRTLQLTRRPVVFHDHYGRIDIDREVPGWFRWWGRHLVDAYVGVSDALGTWAVEAGVPRARVHVIGNALDLARLERSSRARDLRAELGLPADGVLALTVASMREEKGLHVLMEAFGRARTREQLTLLIAGGDRLPGYGERCRDIARRAGVLDRVRFLGERLDVPDLIRSVDLAILPSISESGPLVLIEFLAAGLPVVATLTGDIAMRAQAAGVVGMVPPADAAALAAGIDELVDMAPAARRARGDAGRAIARERFDIAAKLAEWLAVYRAVGAPP